MASRSFIVGFLIAVLAVDSAGKTSRASSADVSNERNARYSLQLENAPLSACLEALSKYAGVRLMVNGPLGNERLVACVPNSTLGEVMDSMAKLYRGRWRKRVRSGSVTHVLEKSDEVSREEVELRRACIRELSRHIEEAANRQTPRGDLPAVLQLQHALRDSLRFLTPDEWGRLSNDLCLAKTLRSFPKSVGEKLIDCNRRATADALEASRVDREESIARGEPIPPEAGPAPNDTVTYADGTLLLDLKQYHGLHLWGALSEGQVTGVTSLGRVSAAGMVELSRKPFEAKTIRPRINASEPGERSDPSDPFLRPLTSGQAMRGEDTPFDALYRLAESTGISIYSDRYSDTEQPMVPITANVTAESAIDSLCQKRAPDAFWWREGRTAYIRSVGWFWDQEPLLPADLYDALVPSIKRSGRLTGSDLARLSALKPAQVAGLLGRPGEFALWNIAVRVPVAAGGTMTDQACTVGFSSSNLNPTQYARLSSLGWPFPLKQGSALRTRTVASVIGAPPRQGVHLELTTVLNGNEQTTSVILPPSRPSRLVVKALP